MKSYKDILLPYQRRFVEDQSKLKIWLASRQIGKSFAAAYEAVWLAAERPRTLVLLVSASERQSKELMEKVRFHMQALGIVLGKLTSKETSEEIRLTNESRIISLPANPDTVRGFSGHVFLDEFALHRDSREIWRALYPTITRGYKIRVLSTPRGKQNMFYELWEHNELFSKHRTTIHDAVAEGLAVEVEELRAGVADEDTWRQEYLCEFLDEATAFITYEMINECEVEKCLWPREALEAWLSGGFRPEGPVYLGMDVGRRRDLSVIAVMEKLGDVLWLRELLEMERAPFAHQREALFSRLRYAVRAAIDETGLGMQLAEEAQEVFGRYRVEAVTFTAAAKEELAVGLRTAFEDRRVRIPKMERLREDLHSVKKTVTRLGHIRFEAERTEDGHADRFWALALAVYAAGRRETWAYMPMKVRWL